MNQHFDQTPDQSEKAARRQVRKRVKQERQARRNPKPLEPRTKSQRDYIDSLYQNSLTFGIGPAGVGKTYVPSRVFGQMLASGELKKIYLSRPPVSKAKHRMGFLPGDAEDKTAPWLVPVFEGIKESMSPARFEQARRENHIEVVPFEFMQGRTFKDSAWIVDEAENLDLDDLYITLTRQGENLKTVISGDIKQTRISNSGLSTVVQMASEPYMEDIGVIEFGQEEVVRSKQARQWVEAFDRITLSNTQNYDIHESKGFSDNPPDFLRI